MCGFSAGIRLCIVGAVSRVYGRCKDINRWDLIAGLGALISLGLIHRLSVLSVVPGKIRQN